MGDVYWIFLKNTTALHDTYKTVTAIQYTLNQNMTEPSEC